MKTIFHEDNHRVEIDKIDPEKLVKVQRFILREAYDAIAEWLPGTSTATEPRKFMDSSKPEE